jgi:hypothetical protein
MKSIMAGVREDGSVTKWYQRFDTAEAKDQAVTVSVLGFRCESKKQVP